MFVCLVCLCGLTLVHPLHPLWDGCPAFILLAINTLSKTTRRNAFFFFHFYFLVHSLFFFCLSSPLLSPFVEELRSLCASSPIFFLLLTVPFFTFSIATFASSPLSPTFVYHHHHHAFITLLAIVFSFSFSPLYFLQFAI